MNTLFALLARFERTEIPLEDISLEFLGITPRTARQRANAAMLPFPTFKVRDSEKAPHLVRAQDLSEYIDKRYAQAREEWESVNLH